MLICSNEIDMPLSPQIKIYQSVHDRLKNILRRGRYTRRTEQIIGLTQVQFIDWLSFNFKDKCAGQIMVLLGNSIW